MSDYNLAGLDPRNFEHLTQSLAAEAIARGITPFGDGPDGGREATYRGRMDYPSAADPWDGYLIIQCKFRQRPHSNTADAGNWALEHLQADLKKFENKKRNLPRPDYYLFVTNVNLTPAPGTGSKDKVHSLLDHYARLLGFKGFDVWDFDKLCRLLDAHTSVRYAYAAFITAGDVLGTLMQLLPHKAPFWEVMSLYLQRELEIDQYARLQQSGDPDQPITLANVFIDLPAGNYESALPDFETPSGQGAQLPPGIVRELLGAGGFTLKPSVILNEEGSSERFSSTTDASSASLGPKGARDVAAGLGSWSQDPGRYVLVGGPGQGKSTIGQFACQLYRAALLRDRPAHTLTPEARNIVTSLEREWQRSGSELPSARRFPMRVVLDQFATSLKNKQSTSLLSYIGSRLNTPEISVSPADVREWLKSHPWFIVLDGLDEVPSTSNRVEVLSQIAEFWRQAKLLDSDVLVLATTRPQGYSEDFSPALYQHRYLTPLSPTRALLYGRRLLQARHGKNEEAIERVYERLSHACEHEATAHLMRTPLQVTIMATLVEQIGRAPQQRWDLFHRYYDAFYDRECEKGTSSSKTLRENRTHVNAIHRHVGVALQAASEKAGRTDSRLPMREFKEVVRGRLDSEGYKGDDLTRLTDEIIEVAVIRLVLLISIGDSIGFEIRSLQEFMAAEALMDGSDGIVQERLRAIAPSAYWRNVFLFAAGKIFAERNQLRDTVCSVCVQLNLTEEDAVAGSVLAGSQLAVAILLEGITRQHPKFARQLAKAACELMTVHAESENARLASVHDATVDHVIREEIEELIRRPNLAETLGSWTVLLILIEKNVPWAVEVAEKNWPQLPNEQHEILKLNKDRPPERWTAAKAAQLVLKLSPEDAYGLQEKRKVPEEMWPRLPSWYPWVQGLTKIRDHTYVPLILRSGSTVNVGFQSTRPFAEPMTTVPVAFEQPHWHFYTAASRFSASPSPSGLAKEIRNLVDVGLFAEPSFTLHALPWITRAVMPWPMTACLDAVTTADDCRDVSARLDAGELGSYEDWITAEDRWATGINEEDLLYCTDEHWPFDRYIAKVGFPLGAHTGVRVEARSWKALVELYEQLPQCKFRSRAALFLVNVLLKLSRALAFSPASDKLTVRPALLLDILLANPRYGISLDTLTPISIPSRLDPSWLDLFDKLWRSEASITIDIDRAEQDAFGSYETKGVVQALQKDLRRTYLLELLAIMAASGSSFRISEPLFRSLHRIIPKGNRDSLLLLQVFLGYWKPHDAQDLVESFVSESGDRDFNYHLFLLLLRRGLEQTFVDVDQQESLLIALHRELRNRASRSHTRTFELLNALLASRDSPLADRQRWRDLQLPSDAAL